MGKVKIYDCEHDHSFECDLTGEQLAEVKQFIKELKTTPKTDYKSVLEEYNAVCRALPPVTRLTDKRKRAIAKAVKNKVNLSELFVKAAESPFLRGENKQKWRASFDWLIVPSNAIKVLEGNYAPSGGMTAQPATPIVGNPFDEYE